MTYMIAHFENNIDTYIDLMVNGNEYYIYLKTSGFEGASKHFKNREDATQLFNRMVAHLVK